MSAVAPLIEISPASSWHKAYNSIQVPERETPERQKYKLKIWQKSFKLLSFDLLNYMKYSMYKESSRKRFSVNVIIK